VSTGRARAAARRNSGSDLGARVLVAIPAIAIAIALVAAGGWVFAAGMFVLGALCMHELFLMLERTRPVKLAAFLSLAGLIVAAHLGDAQSVLLALVISVPVVFLLAVVMPDVADVVPPMAVTIFAIVWIGVPFAHAMLLRDLPHGDAIVVDVLVGTFIGDTGAYLGGRALGRRPLSPRLSPNKTVEGLAIGIVAGVAAVWFAGLYQDWLSGTDALLIGLAVALVAPVGDLFESAVKRGAGTKDTGRLFGAHGGALDRLDAVIFSIVAGYWVWRALLG
jgi:phosphatidate cytidylyltransferase